MFLRTVLFLCFVAFVAKTTTGQRPQGPGPRGRQQDMNRYPQQPDPRNQGQPQYPQNPQGNPRSQQGNQQPSNQPQENPQPTNQEEKPRQNQPMMINEGFARNLVEWHNNLRMKPNASNMVQMEWNDELVKSARLAQKLHIYFIKL